MTDRATSTTLSYVLTLSIATILVGGLIIAGSTFVEDRREQVIRQELEVIGEHIAGNIDQVDRYASASDDLSTARVEQTFPDDVTGSTYDVKLVPGGGDPTLFLNSTRPAVSVSVDVTTTASVSSDTAAGGGTIVVRCVVSGGDCTEVELTNA